MSTGFTVEENSHYIKMAAFHEHFLQSMIARDNVAIDCCTTTAPAPCPPMAVACMSNKRKNEMYMEVNTDGRSDLAVTRSFLRDRLSDAKESKRLPTQRAFGMADDERPRTANELIERIKSGKFTIDADRGDTKAYDPAQFLNWRDPDLKKDEKGYTEAWQAIRDAKNAAEIIIMTGDALEGRKALTDFQQS